MSVFCDHGSATCVRKSRIMYRVTVSLRIMALYIGVNFIFVAILRLVKLATGFLRIGCHYT